MMSSMSESYSTCHSDSSAASKLSPTDRLIMKKTSKANSIRRRELQGRDLSYEELQDLRLKVNSRERMRMQDLNKALDSLRSVLPYANDRSVRKLSKIATLLLAKNHIIGLTQHVRELEQKIQHNASSSSQMELTRVEMPAHSYADPMLNLFPIASTPTLPIIENGANRHLESHMNPILMSLFIQNQIQHHSLEVDSEKKTSRLPFSIESVCMK